MASVRQNHNRNTMRKLHVAISTNRIEDTIKDYSARFGVEPCAIVEGEYALWRTEALNVSVRQDPTCKPGELRHLGWEDSTAVEFSKDTDINGIVWKISPRNSKQMKSMKFGPKQVIAQDLSFL